MALAILLLGGVSLVKHPGAPPAGPALSAIDRRCLVGSFAPLLALRPLASLAAADLPYLPPGQETEEFKSLDARATAFKREQIKYASDWQQLTSRLVSATTDAEAIDAFVALKKAFRESGRSNLPEGVSRDAFLKKVRRKQREMEADGKWEKPVRMEFLELKTAIDTSLRPKGMSDSGAPTFG
ncbi:hypothetical protein KFE25_005899 [Diacronema lutheri]|uniref:Uncharacterized protein n=2 Tax=Diacronema lutheri TaxID=2081491 RepID=A0A8J5Y150_DIALT|nr:hypothetical protein KFE25_005899 [Diacronema lutheri]